MQSLRNRWKPKPAPSLSERCQDQEEELATSSLGLAYVAAVKRETPPPYVGLKTVNGAVPKLKEVNGAPYEPHSKPAASKPASPSSGMSAPDDMGIVRFGDKAFDLGQTGLAALSDAELKSWPGSEEDLLFSRLRLCARWIGELTVHKESLKDRKAELEKERQASDSLRQRIAVLESQLAGITPPASTQPPKI